MQGILQQKITKQSRNYNQASQEITIKELHFTINIKKYQEISGKPGKDSK